MQADQTARFWDKFAPRYSKQPIADEAAYQKKLQVTQQYLHADMSVLEVGCGTGSTAILHAPYVKHILATDISGKMLEIAEGKAAAQGLTNVTFQQCGVDGLQAPDESFDAILALNVLHLLEDRDQAIGKIYRLLKPGGVFVSSTMCLGDGMNFLRYVVPVGQFFGLIPTLVVFSRRELEQSLVSAGFNIEHQWQPEKSKGVFIVAKRVA